MNSHVQNKNSLTPLTGKKLLKQLTFSHQLNQTFRQHKLLLQASQKYIQADENIYFPQIELVLLPHQERQRKIQIDDRLNTIRKSNKTIRSPSANQNNLDSINVGQDQEQQQTVKHSQNSHQHHEPNINYYHQQYIKLSLTNHQHNHNQNQEPHINPLLNSPPNASANNYCHLYTHPSDHQLFILQLQSIIYIQVKSMQLKQLKGNYVLEHVTDDLDIQFQQLQSRIKTRTRLTFEELLRLRMHIQAVCKILVFIHGKSEFRLVTAHYYLGQAYKFNQCYEQAIDHLTIALKKNSKLTEVKQTKIYHSFILTSLSECYFLLQLYSDSLQILLRAYEIQQCYVNSQLKINNIKTIKLISECYLRLKNYKHAIQYMQKICLIVERLKGGGSKEYAQVKFEKARIVGDQGNLLGAIQEVKLAIELVQGVGVITRMQKDVIVLKYKLKLAEFLQRFGDFQSQIQCLKEMIEIISAKRQKQNKRMAKKFVLKNLIAIKKKIIVIAVKHSDYNMAVNQLEQVLVILCLTETLQQQKHSSNSIQVNKTLKMLGLVHLHLGNQRHAQEYLKKCHKFSQELRDKNDLQKIYYHQDPQNRASIIHKNKLSIGESTLKPTAN